VQIEQGAKVDVFASADWKHMKTLATQGLVAEPTVFARNLPVVVVPKNNPAKVTTFADLAKVKHLVVGAPEVPIGAYTENIFAAAEKLQGKAFAEKVRANVRSRELNVRQVLTKVAMGEGDAGIVYKTDALTMPDKVEIIEIPASINVVAEYPIAALKAAPHADLARDFVKLVLSKEGVRVLGQRRASARPRRRRRSDRQVSLPDDEPSPLWRRHGRPGRDTPALPRASLRGLAARRRARFHLCAASAAR
jgi:molybdate transport system substrate-binding protein